jgi:predicted glycoside hydrolase/deacetylase ChbG (UPF0249 family)
MFRVLKHAIIVMSILMSNLGFAQVTDDEIYYLIRLDDMGMCHAKNMAIKQVLESGLPVSTSVMFACPWWQEAVDILKDYPKTGVGIHLTLNAEWKNYRWGPVLGATAVPSLVDSNGYFFPSRAQLFAHQPKQNEIERELRAQIERAMNSEIQIDYLDYHMGAAVHTPELRQLVESLAEEYGLGMSGYFSENYSNITYHADFGTKLDSLSWQIENLEPGINLQVVHVGLDNSEMSALEDLNEFGLPQMSKHRQEELAALLDPKIRQLLSQKGVKLITYKDLINMIGLESMYRPEDSEY